MGAHFRIRRWKRGTVGTENLKAGQQALYHRARCNGAASRGTYTDEMEGELVDASSSAHRREWRDD